MDTLLTEVSLPKTQLTSQHRTAAEQTIMASVTVSPCPTASDDELNSCRREQEPDEGSHQLADSLCSATLPAEQRLRSRIDKFLAGFGLTPMGTAVALSWIQSIGSDTTGDFARVRGWLVGRLNAFGQGNSQSSLPGNPWQRDCPEIIPGLRSKAFWSADDFDLPWVTDFERGFLDVREELLALRGRGGFQPYRAPRRYCKGKGEGEPAEEDGIGSKAHRGGDWNVFYLLLHNTVDFSEHREMCPKTVSLVEALPRHHKHAFFSALAPGTHVVKHNGPTNKKLRVHLPVLAPARGLSRLRVGSETREAVAGKALVFDDSFEHEAWNDSSGTGDRNGSGNGNGTENDADNSTGSLSLSSEGDSEPLRKGRPGETGQDRHGVSSPGEAMGTGDTKSTQAESGAAPRVTLIADVWHPDLSNSEVRFMSFLQEANLRVEKRLVQAAEREATLLHVPRDDKAQDRLNNADTENGNDHMNNDDNTTSESDYGRCAPADNFLGVINRARGVRSDESNIFGD